MNTRKRTRIAIAALVVGVIAPAAPAVASQYAPVDDPPPAQGPAADQGNGTQGNGTETVVLRRDGDRSAQFVAEASPEAATPAGGPGDAFDWGDAAIGAGASLLAVALVASGTGAVSGRRRRTPTTANAAS